MAGIAAALADPPQAAAQAVGVKRADLPDLTIKEVKVYVADVSGFRRLNSGEPGEIISIVTNSGHEGNYTLGNRNPTTNWLEWAKSALVGKNVIDLLPTLTATTGTRETFGFGGRRGATGPGGRPGAPAGGGRGPAGAPGAMAPPRGGGGTWPNYYTSAAETCLWDLLGKAVNRPIYKILGGTKDKVLAYASSQHLATVEDFGPDALKAKAAGFKAYKIHPGNGQHKGGSQIPSYLGHIDEIKEVRKAVGDGFTLLYDAVQRYNYPEALKVGRALDEYGYVSFEDPMQTYDIDGLVELRKHLDVPTEVGEFILSVYDYGEFIRRGAMSIVRLITDNVGGITGSFRVGQLAETFGMPCTPHNWGTFFDLAAGFQVELALNNCYWFEMVWPWEYADRPYVDYKFRIDADGYVPAPKDPGMGYPLNRAALDKIMIRIDR
jgi:L-alanine-DL-glutamate epimerase-like enolase superfamily enzyme